jgi:tryptophanyl-tRNA synthetase
MFTMQHITDKVILTGDRPTGRLHLGHFVGSLKNRVALQDNNTQFVMIADMQALTDNAENPVRVRESVLEVALDNLASGVDPKKTTFFIQSQIPQLAELTMYFMNLVTLARLRRNPTVKSEMTQKGFEENVPMGFLAYPISQAADILFCKATHVPVGEDQKPMIEQTNEIARKFNTLYGETFSEVEAIVPEDTSSRLSGIDGKAKMSKSLNNAIYLSDSEENISEKVMQMYTDPEHVHKEDPGHLEGNVVFEYLCVFDEDKSGLQDLMENYKKGGVGDVEIKKRLIGVLNTFISPIRKKREELEKDSDALMEILKEGSEKAREVAANTLDDVKKKMKINYFGN